MQEFEKRAGAISVRRFWFLSTHSNVLTILGDSIGVKCMMDANYYS
jgi:hypothetical protein